MRKKFGYDASACRRSFHRLLGPHRASSPTSTAAATTTGGRRSGRRGWLLLLSILFLLLLVVFRLLDISAVHSHSFFVLKLLWSGIFHLRRIVVLRRRRCGVGSYYQI